MSKGYKFLLVISMKSDLLWKEGFTTLRKIITYKYVLYKQ